MTDSELEKKIKEEKLIKLIARIVLISAPLLGSIVSSFHVFDFLMLFMMGWMSFTIAFTYEVIQLGILFAIIVLPNYKSAWIWVSFIFILFIQFLGNVYYVFEFFKSRRDASEDWGKYLFDLSQQFSNWIDKLMAFINGKNWTEQIINIDNTILIYAVIIGIMVPAVSLMMIKAASGFLNTSNSGDGSASSLEEERKSKEELEQKLKAQDQKITASLTKMDEKMIQVDEKMNEAKETIETSMGEVGELLEEKTEAIKSKVMDGIKLTVEEKSKEFDNINSNLQDKLDEISDTTDKLSIKS